MKTAVLRNILAFIAALSAIACSSSATPSSSVPEDGEADAGVSCPEGMRAGADDRCELLLSPAVCPPGTRPAVGRESCAPVGAACAEGFERDATGFGCAPVLPAEPCTGATMPKLGERTCVAVGTCSDAVPAGAIVVDPTLAPEALDATHVRTLAEAVMRASAGATIALAAGAHIVDELAVTKPLTIVGRCAAETKLVPAHPPTPSWGLVFVAAATLRGVTLEGYARAISVETDAASLVADEIVVQGGTYRGLRVGRGATMTLKRSVVRGVETRSPSEATMAAYVHERGLLRLEESAVLDSVDGAVAASGVGSEVVLDHSVVARVSARPDGEGGTGVWALEGAHVEVRDSAILDTIGVAAVALVWRQDGSAADAERPHLFVSGGVIADVAMSAGSPVGVGVMSSQGALAELDGVTLSRVANRAVYVSHGSAMRIARSSIAQLSATSSFSVGAHVGAGCRLSVEDSAFVELGGMGIEARGQGASATVTRCLVSNVGGEVVRGHRVGVGTLAADGALVSVVDSAVVDAREVSLLVSDEGTRLAVEDVFVARTKEYPFVVGHGVVAMDSASFTLARSVVEGAPGVAVVVSGGFGVVNRSLIRSNAVAVQVQSGGAILEGERPSTELSPNTLFVSTDTRFIANATRVGSSELVLPTLPASEP